jgi:hypothetical protein
MAERKTSDSLNGNFQPKRSKPGEPSVCYYLGLNDDNDTWLAFPSPGNFCHYLEKPAPIDYEHQSAWCLTANYGTCPVYKLKTQDRLPAGVALYPTQNGSLRPNGRALTVLLIVILLLSAAALLIIRPSFTAGIIPPANDPAGAAGETATSPATAAAITATAAVAVAGVASPSATNTPLPTPTGTPLPTATAVPPSATPSASATPSTSPTPQPTATLMPASPTPSPAPDLPQIVVNVNNLNVRSGPRVEYPVIEIISRGTRLDITGRTSDQVWLLVCCLEETGSSGWVFTGSVIVEGELDSVPVISEIPPLPEAP